jgi:hypothetical protein
MTTAILDRVWEGAGDTWAWLRGVVLGEWEDNRSTSQIVTDALAGFVPGIGSIITLRDLIAVIVRLAKHPDKREEVEEWILLVAMLLPLIITIAGAAVAGVGALVGAELGGFLRAVALFVVKNGGVALKALVEFLQGHGYGNAVEALRQVKFAAYRDGLVKGLNQQLDKLGELARGLQARLRSLGPESLPAWLPGRDAAIAAIRQCDEFVRQLDSLRRKAVEMIPKALIEMDRRLGALLAGNVKAATQVTHTVATGVEAPVAVRVVPDQRTPGMGRNPEPPEPGNTRRVRERRLAQFYVQKNRQEYRFVNSKGIPVGAKPFHEGKTVVEHPRLTDEDWAKHEGAAKNGYPDLTKPGRSGKATSEYSTFSNLRKADLQPGEKIVRVVAHDAKPYSDSGSYWTRTLPEDGRQFRSGTAVKEDWNKDGSYVEMTVPPKGHPVWKELGQDPANPSLKGWEGTAAAQRYEYVDPKTGKIVKEDAYLPGGDPQLFLDADQVRKLKEAGFIKERRPTNFKDYDPNVPNTDGSKGNIVSHGDIVFENVPLDQAVLRAQHVQREGAAP